MKGGEAGVKTREERSDGQKERRMERMEGEKGVGLEEGCGFNIHSALEP